MNIHTPERQPDETQQQYRERQKLSKRMSRQSQLAGIGDQHKAPSSRERQRDDSRAAGTFKAGSFGRGLLNSWNAKRRNLMKNSKRRDEHGAYTLVGQQPHARLSHEDTSRIWLGGISAQRGY